MGRAAAALDGLTGSKPRHHDVPNDELSPALLPTRWRSVAAELRAYGADSTATTLERVAAELDAALRSAADTPLTLIEAAHESGYSADYLGRLIAKGSIENIGRKNAPKIRRGDLPRKAGALPPAASGDSFSLVRRRLARAVVNASRQEARDG
jgi:hypothetical protein